MNRERKWPDGLYMRPLWGNPIYDYECWMIKDGIGHSYELHISEEGRKTILASAKHAPGWAGR